MKYIINVIYRALAEQIKSFLDTAVNPKYRRNAYHKALYDWHVLESKTSANPGRPPYSISPRNSSKKSKK